MKNLPSLLLNRKILIGLILSLLALLLLARPKTPDELLVAKGGQTTMEWTPAESAAIETQARAIALADGRIQEMLPEDYGFLYAVPLGEGEASAWAETGCRSGDCAQVTFYDYEAGGTVEAVISLAEARVIAGWVNIAARPGASQHVLPRAWAIAAGNEEVTAVIGNVRTAEPLMVPMSTWMEEGECRDSWCVDLTFLAPDGSGQVFHVLVDMESETVVQTFFTRGLAERTYSQPQAQGGRYHNGCHEQYGWSVCWEMTAHDGINFYDAEYIGRSVFSSAKISQVEVFYPDWPGGYRDEIGYGSTVPPYFGTHITDLGDGFEVQQLYTEFLRWPNCICCYRYEQIIRFYDDGAFEPRFISHGPGCDDDSVYRPFWRIDLDLTGPEDNEVWFWENGRWQEALTERSINLFEDKSPDNHKLFTAGGGLRYYWQPVRTDPLGGDDGRLFLLQWDETEGVGPIATGPADTFWPPGQWLNGEQVSGGNYVIWYIPILNTSWMEPWWCVPDPEPDFSPCEAILRIEPGGVLVMQPTVEPIDTEEPPTPAATRTAGPTATPRPIAGEDGPAILLNAGCGACHALDSLGLDGEIGPDLTDAAAWAGQRVDGLTAAEYIRQSILDPEAFVAPDCPKGPCQPGIMPDNYGRRLSPEQLNTVITYLLDQGTAPSQSEGTSLPPSIGNNEPEPEPPTEVDNQDSPPPSSSLFVISFITLIIIIGLGLVLLNRKDDQTLS